MDKFFNIETIGNKVEIYRSQNKKIGLITGCFDVLHIGHIELFRFAKQHVDILIVGIDNDQTIKKSKGETRPIFDQVTRVQVLSELQSVDYVYIFDKVYKYGDSDVDLLFDDVLKSLKPNYLITTAVADKFTAAKKARLEKFGIELLINTKIAATSTTQIIQLLD